MLAVRRFAQFVILLGIVALGVSTVYAEDLSVKEGQWNVALIKTAKCQDPECIGGRAFEFKITKLPSGQSRAVILRNETRSVTSLFLHGQKLIVQGKLPYAGDIANIIDLPEGKLIDTIFGYDMQASPDKRYLLYSLWYPRMSQLQSRKTIVFLYDVKSSPNLNRIDKGAGTLGPRGVGIPVYPKSNWTGSSFSGYPAAPSFSIHPSPRWFAGNQKVLFTAWDRADLYNLVIVNLKGGLSQVEICTVPLVPRLVSQHSGAGQKGRAKIRYALRSVDIKDDNEATLQFYKQQGIELTINVNIRAACIPR